MNFGAVILAGGKSSRMGRDKACLEIGGQSLLARQIQCVRAAGAREVFISGRRGTDYSPLGCPVLEDEFPEAGPLAGIAAALAAVREPLLLVLAVDMANISGDFLGRLHAHCGEGLGAVPVCDKILEPLAAFYPKAADELARKLLAATNGVASPGAKHFAKACEEAGWVRCVAVPPHEVSVFKSWNSRADLPPEIEWEHPDSCTDRAKPVPQTSKSAVSPISKSAGLGDY
jgi:molybdopterin-guanine dinucleotide biosynthesis protein A